MKEIDITKQMFVRTIDGSYGQRVRIMEISENCDYLVERFTNSGGTITQWMVDKYGNAINSGYHNIANKEEFDL